MRNFRNWSWYKYWRNKQHVPKITCENQVCLDSFLLFRQGEAQAQFTLPKQAIKGKLYGLVIKVVTPSLSYSIPIDKQLCHFGGYRYFFRCPNSLCNKRMRLLYLSLDGSFLCRQCLNLCYFSQRCQVVVR
jgi:hypothetical protein